MRGFTRGPAAAYSIVMAGLLAFSGASFAATVVLRDGTVIHGEVTSLQDDVYSVETDSLGTIRVRKQEVRSIDDGAEPTSRADFESSTNGSSPRAGELDATQSRIMQDPKLLATVLALQDDPDVLAVLADPEITKAMAAGDYAALQNNPKIVALMHNAKMREIIDGVR
jgi:hypothetical protein